MQGIECILLDMDGVIANFVDRSITTAGLPISHDDCDVWGYFEKWMTTDEFWTKIEADDQFWFKLKPYDWARELYDMLTAIAPVSFCSTPSRDADAASQKIEWLREYAFMDRDEDRYFLVGVGPSAEGHKRGKNLLAGRRRILIDDSDANVRDFKESGGMAILFPQPWNGAREYTYDRIGYVKRQLQECLQIVDLAGQIREAEEKIIADSLSNVAVQPENPKDAIGATKIPMSVVPPVVLMEVAMSMMEGAWKYRSYNYRKIPIRYSRYYDAALRHLMSWWEGEDIDPDSGLSHITKLISCSVVLRDAMIQSENGDVHTIDDRPPKSKLQMSGLQKLFDSVRARLQSQHGPMKPPYTEVG